MSQPQAFDTSSAGTKTSPPPRGLLFELERAAPARRMLYEVLSERLKERGLEWPLHLHLRHGLGSSPEFYMQDILDVLDARRFSQEKLAEEVRSDFSGRIGDGEVALTPAFESLLQAAEKLPLQMIAVSALPEQDAKALHARLGLEGPGVRLLCSEPQHRQFPRIEHWVTACRELGMEPRACTALASSDHACHSALSVGMPCIAVPDEYTAFQDFSGALCVVEPESEAPEGGWAEWLCPAAVAP